MTELSTVAGILLSLLFEYVPGFRDWFNKLEDVEKRLSMAVILLISVAVIFALSCCSPLDWVDCTQAGIWTLLEAFFVALVANQTTHRIAKR